MSASQRGAGMGVAEELIRPVSKKFTGTASTGDDGADYPMKTRAMGSRDTG